MMGRYKEIEIERHRGGLSKEQQRWSESVGDMYFHNNFDNFESVLSFGDDPGVLHACSCTPFPICFPDVDSQTEYFTATDNQ